MMYRVTDTIFGYCPAPMLALFLLLCVAWWPLAGLAALGKIEAAWFFAEWGAGVAWAFLCLLAGMIRRYSR